jgi:hypothetical protein
MNNFKIYLLFSPFFVLSISSFQSYAQTDTIISNNQKIACSVKEITPDAVKYTFPNEDLINTVYKNTIQKIIFKSGRMQTFAEATSYKTISGVMDFDKVTITSVESEVRGLYKIGDVSSKAKGTTVYSNQERVKDRAYRKMKIQAAMFGANVIYLTNQRTEGNKYGSYYSSGSTAETNLTGIAYSNALPDFEQFEKIIANHTTLLAIQKFELGASDSNVSINYIETVLTITNIINESGIVYIEGNLQGEKNVNRFQLVNYNNSNFSIAFKEKGTAYNFVIKL